MKKILIVDDDPRNIFALKATLKSKGLNCLTASGAQEAIELIKTDPGIELVLMDMMMPEMDGYEAIGYIRNELGRSDLTLIALTAQAMVGDREKCLQAGADDYISKPVNVDLLMSLLKKYRV